ncbi:pyrimidine 5'-nucleotidase [Shewanella surugensis]|uniref:Pyrimidine 5'-nucleotidase n=1 Tax=Shewanella surugensis TaxID=212020 RepID=A0ABT0LJ89_9GAMM|nr:pyrimidine 5'-nucleotidase [Shewanella surugensis]MCL1127769.1 pyrimidine 5'-nucleotidase [Shewanella surugensis]
MKYQWILFDADETLFHFDAFKGLQILFSRFNVEFTQEDFDYYQQVNLKLWVSYQAGEVSAKQLQEQRFQSWAEKLNVTPKVLNSGFLNAMGDICCLLPGGQVLIDALKGKVRLGIITNGFTALQTIRLQRTGLLDIFSLVVISEEVGLAKPDVGIFEYAFDRMGQLESEKKRERIEQPEPVETFDRNRVLMVGDNQHSDIKGGMNAGIDTCWLNRFDESLADNIKPTYQVCSLLELKELLIPSAVAV